MSNQQVIDQKNNEINKLRIKENELVQRLTDSQRKNVTQLANFRQRLQDEKKVFLLRQDQELERESEKQERSLKTFEDQITETKRSIERFEAEVQRLQVEQDRQNKAS